MEENKKNSKNILYLVIGIMTLVIATAGATFAYYTATASNNTIIKGNMATITFNLTVEKKTNVDETKGGLIPMTNSMVQKAVSNASSNGICVDDNGNPVCQIYKITVNNTGSAVMFLDGYVNLTGGSGTPTDYTSATTTMRWAQVFCQESSGSLVQDSCTTAGKTTTHGTTASNTAGIDSNWTALGATTNSGNDAAEIKDNIASVTGTGTIAGNTYSLIKTNYIRVSKHSGTKFAQSTDVPSALVYNQRLTAYSSSANHTGDSNTTYTDSQVYYIVVWLTETGHNQTVGSGGTSVPTTPTSFFQGTVVFNSSQGSEVTSTFSGYAAVNPDT